MATSVYLPCATCFLPDELSLDFSTEVEILPIAVDDALKADELSASAGVHSSTGVSATSAAVRCSKWCIGAEVRELDISSERPADCDREKNPRACESTGVKARL